ncbi:MAG TPA: hypothetical protein VLR94_09825 [Acidobacteriota bacterium]|nr:hypothetical protein [Acidobacteriota bacterium]
MSLAIRWTAAVLLVTSFASADIIYLKSGRQILCDKAWEEGKQVKYIVSEGTVGIPRSLVSKIVKSAPQNVPKQSSPQTAPSAVLQSQPSEALTPESRLKQAVAFTTMGNALIEKKDPAGALDYFKKAYEMVKTKDTTFNLALVYYILKDEWNASLLFHELLRLDPRNTDAMNHLAEMAWRKENLDEALS